MKELGLSPRMAHCVIALDPETNDIALMYPSAHKAELDTGIKGIYDAVLGLRKMSGCYKWAWLFD